MLGCGVTFRKRHRITAALVSASLLGSAGVLGVASTARAADDTPSIVSYGFDGFWTGADIGLATGYLATGRVYESREWRKLVFGAGVGALVGVGVGLTLGIVDVGQPPPRTGWLILRDTGYGTSLGAVVGIAVGALSIIDSGSPKALVRGAAYGTLIGGGVGIAFGVLESVLADRHPSTTVITPAGAPAKAGATLRFGVTAVESDRALLPVPALFGTF